MKKSKIIVPALAMIGLSAVASITGSVAWFTAQRTAQITTNEFAVVKTAGNLALALGEGVGTTGTTGTTVVVAGSNKLTDSSLDHNVTGTSGPYIVTPNVARDQVLRNSPIKGVAAGTLATDLTRGNNIYSAFTWTMTFTATFVSTTDYAQGLFLDLSDDATYMHEAFTVKSGQSIPANSYSDANCATEATGNAPADTTYYRKEPDASGKAFRIAFIPTTVPTGSYGLAKVWADNEGSDTNEGKFIHGLAEAAALGGAGTSYGVDTVSLTGDTYSAATVGTAIMKSTGTSTLTHDNTGIPADNSTNHTSALSSKSNYLGYFGVPASMENPNVSMTFTCVAWYEGTHPQIKSEQTDFERIVASMKFGVSNLNA